MKVLSALICGLAALALLPALAAVLGGCSGDAELKVVGAPTADVVPVVLIPSRSVVAGTTTAIPIFVDDISGIAGTDFVIVFDGDLLAVQAVRPTSFTQSFVIQPLIEPDTVRIRTAGPVLPLISAPLFDVVFLVKEEAENGDTTEITFTQATLLDADGDPIPGVEVQNGRITVE